MMTNECFDGSHAETCDRLKKEMTHLEAELAEYKRLRETWKRSTQDADDRIATLEAENARLREALEIATHSLGKIEMCAQSMSAAESEAKRALRIVLPMAKGYAYEHPVGRNREMVECAEQALAGKESA